MLESNAQRHKQQLAVIETTDCYARMSEETTLQLIHSKAKKNGSTRNSLAVGLQEPSKFPVQPACCWCFVSMDLLGISQAVLCNRVVVHMFLDVSKSTAAAHGTVNQSLSANVFTASARGHMLSTRQARESRIASHLTSQLLAGWFDVEQSPAV